MGAGLKRIALDRGTIHAYIWAPAGEFVVDTPSAVTVDLGCAYKIKTDESGDTEGAAVLHAGRRLAQSAEAVARLFSQAWEDELSDGLASILAA